MTDLTFTHGGGPSGLPLTIKPSSQEWPAFAPVWAATAILEVQVNAVTFSREWAIPSMYRDAEPLLVIRVDQEFNYCAAIGSFTCGEQRITAGPPTLWADYRREEIASTLRSIADALAPTGGVGEV